MGCNCDQKCSFPVVNEGTVDRVIRGSLAAALVAVGLRQRGVVRVISLGVAGALAVTAATGYCWCYEQLGVSTADGCGCGCGCECGDDCTCSGDETGGRCGHQH